MKICTIFTGGTIGSVLGMDGYIGPKDGTAFRLLHMYRERYDTDVTFETVEAYHILSENLNGEYITRLFRVIRQVLDDGGVDGIIVTHGTDTLQYGAAMLGYVFGGAAIPIMLVSSNYVLEDPRANGLTNFHYAVEFIKGQYGKGVFVSYCNIGENPTIHRGTRLQPCVPYSDYVASVQNAWYGRFENGNYISNCEYHVKKGQVALFENERDVVLTKDAREILYLHPYVGMRYPELNDKTKAILHASYHSGTICVEGALQQFVKDAQKYHIPIYLTGFAAGTDAYETVQVYEKMGVQILYTSSEVAQYCKMWLAISNGLDVSSVMEMSVAEDWV